MELSTTTAHSTAAHPVRHAGLGTPGVRRLHLLDVENLLSGEVSPTRVRAFWQMYRDQHVGPQDLVVVACAERVAGDVLFNLPATVRVVLGEDVPDGADRALIEAVDATHQAARFDEVLLGSGDGVFVPLVTEFITAGCPVELVTPYRDVSAALRLACTSHTAMALHRLPVEPRSPRGRLHRGRHLTLVS